MSMLKVRPVTDQDLPLLTRWLNKEYILIWYQDAEEWLWEIQNRNGDFDWIHHFIVLAGTIPIGFCQYYDCYKAQEHWYHVAQPDHTYSIDYLIGEEAYLHKGYGKAIVRWLTETIKTNTNAKYIIVQPEQENIASNRVLLANQYGYNSEKQYYVLSLNPQETP